MTWEWHPWTAKVKIFITSSILAGMGQMRSLLASMQRVDVDGVVA
jgi:hypothetical protein